MKKITFVSMLALALAGCNNVPTAEKKPEEQTVKATPAPQTAVTDTAVGIEGCEKAQFDGNTYTYAAAKVKVIQNDAGEIIEVNGEKIPNEEADFFSGVYKNFLLIDNGTGPNGRTLKVWGIDKKEVIFTALYEGDLSIKDDKLNFIMPVDLKKTKLPKPVNCPDAEKWKKDGLNVGYGIPTAYNFAKNAATATGNAICFAVQ